MCPSNFMKICIVSLYLGHLTGDSERTFTLAIENSEPTTAIPATTTAKPTPSTAIRYKSPLQVAKPTPSTAAPATTTAKPAATPDTTPAAVTITALPALIPINPEPIPTAAIPANKPPAATDEEPDPRSVNAQLLREVESPCNNSSWMYSNRTGYCYMYLTGHHTWAEASQQCLDIKGQLLLVEDEIEAYFVGSTLMRFTYSDHWLNSKFTPGTNYLWPNGITIYEGAAWASDQPVAKDGYCLMIRRNLRGQWIWMSSPCSGRKYVFCRQKARRCPPIYTAEHVVPSFNRPNIELIISYRCEKGYILPNYTERYENWQLLVAENKTNETEPVIREQPTMETLCGRDGHWKNESMAVAPCEAKTCANLPEIKDATHNITNASVSYPAFVRYSCRHGFLFNDVNSLTRVGYCASDDYQWRQMDGVLRLRTKMPTKCDPVRCGEFKAPDELQVYHGDKDLYGETRAFRCPIGKMYPDRTVWQFIKCGRNFVNMLEGRWNDTELPGCETLSCRKPHWDNNTLPNMTIYELNNMIWSHKVQLSYTCAPGYEFPDSSEGLITTCSEDAVWRPSIPKCVKKPKKIKTVGRRYQPEPEDAPRAKEIGSLASVFVLIMLAVIVLLDLTSLMRDLKRMKSNIRHFTRRFTHPVHTKTTRVVEPVA